jgi:hypothetical protein
MIVNSVHLIVFFSCLSSDQLLADWLSMSDYEESMCAHLPSHGIV